MTSINNNPESGFNDLRHPSTQPLDERIQQYDIKAHPDKIPKINVIKSSRRRKIAELSAADNSILQSKIKSQRQRPEKPNFCLTDPSIFNPEDPYSYSTIIPAESIAINNVQNCVEFAEINPRNPNQVIVYTSLAKLAKERIILPHLSGENRFDNQDLHKYQMSFPVQIAMFLINDIPVGKNMESLEDAKELIRIPRDGLSLIKDDTSSLTKEVAVKLDLGVRKENDQPAAIVYNRYRDLPEYENKFLPLIKENLKDEYKGLPFEEHFSFPEMRTTLLAANTMRKTEGGKLIYFGRGLLPPHSDLNVQEIADQADLMLYKFRNKNINDPIYSFHQDGLDLSAGEIDFWYNCIKDKIPYENLSAFEKI